MITIKGLRITEKGETAFPDKTDRPTLALVDMLLNEIAYGGKITESSEESLTVETKVPGALERTTYSGSVEDMHKFVVAVRTLEMMNTEIPSQDTEAGRAAAFLIGRDVAYRAMFIIFEISDKDRKWLPMCDNNIGHAIESLESGFSLRSLRKHGSMIDLNRRNTRLTRIALMSGFILFSYFEATIWII